jgi:hypothetical protein
MSDARRRGRSWRLLRYIAGFALCLLTVVAARAGMPWYWSVIVLCAAFLIILGRRRIFRPGVVRTADQISCRYVPWFEGNAYYANLALPLTGAAMLFAGLAPGNPVWLRFGGGILLLFTPIFLDSAIRLWRKSILRISPSTLTVPLAAPKFEPMELTRERVQAVAPKWVVEVSGVKTLRVEISYRAADLIEPPKTVLLGLQLTVEPHNLLDALTTWKDASVGDDPHELMDRIEHLLLGRSSAQV